MVSIRGFLVFLMALAGMATSLGELQAFNISIKGKLYYNDGVSTLVGGDAITVQVMNSSNMEITGCTTMTGQTSYAISFDPAVAIPGANKSITINFLLNGKPDRSIEGVNGNDGRTQYIDIAVSKAPLKPQAGQTNNIIQGYLYYSNGTQKILSSDAAAVSALTRDNKSDAFAITQPTSTNPNSYTIQVNTTKIMCADKSITITFLLNGVSDRTADGISAIGTPGRPEILDINYSKANPQGLRGLRGEYHEGDGTACEPCCDPCGHSRRCGMRPRLAIFRRGCR